MEEKLRREMEHLTNLYLNDKLHIQTSIHNFRKVAGMDNIVKNLKSSLNVYNDVIKDIRKILEETK